MKKILILLLAAAMLLGMVACDSGDSGDSGDDPVDTQDTLGTAFPVTDAPTEEPTAAPTEEPTEEPTEAPTETETEAETRPPEPQALAHISFDEIARKGLDIKDYLLRPSQTTAAIAQDGETNVLSLTSTKVVNLTASDPYVHLNYEKLAEALGGLPVDTREYPYLVLRIKATDLYSHTFCLYGYPTSRVTGAGAIGEQKARIKDTDDWQYIRFDLTATEQSLVAFRFDYVNATIKEDTVLISDMYFCKTEEEALTMTGIDTYPIADQTAEDYVLNIMSFNVQTENGTSVRMDLRADMLRDLIDEYMPDSIGMQEVTPTWRTLMDTYVFNASYTGVGVPRTDNASLGLEQSCIFYRSDKYELLDSGTFWLSDTPDVVGSKIDGANYPRICTYVYLKDKVTGVEYIHMNTHLDHNGDNKAKVGREIRLAQASVILKKLASLPDVPVVITGDFNQLAHNSDGEAYTLYKLMTGERALTLDDGTEITFDLADTRVHAPENMPEGFTATMTQYHKEGGEKYQPDREPIDYVFYSSDKLEALSYAIRLYDKEGTYLSDHLPVITSFKVTPAVAE